MGLHKRFDADGDEPAGKQRPALSVDGPNGNSASAVSKKGKFTQKGIRNKRMGSSKSVKGNIRSIQRLLKNKGAEMAPAARKAKEVQLEELIRIKDEHERRELERTMVKKYRMIKFFERRKLQRTLDMIVQKGDKQEDAEQKKQILADLRYINEYPKDKKYLALFPSGGHTEESRKRLEQMRKEILTKRTEAGVEGAAKESSEPKQGELEKMEDDFFLNAAVE